MNKTEAIVLVHGIWMKGPELLYLRYKFWRQGYKTYQFHYPSVLKSPEENAASLFKYISKIDSPVVHFVAHSLGGIVVTHLFANYEIQQQGKVVLIGSPVKGSAIAKQLYKNWFMRLLLGKSVINGLLGNVPDANFNREVCVIAGTKGFGVGKLLARKALVQPNDGTVNLVETQLECATESHQLPKSHFLLLGSKQVVSIILNILQKA